MRKYLKILETSKRDRLRKTVSLRHDDEHLSQWKAISLTEEMAGVLLERLARVLPPELEVKVKNVKLDMIRETAPGSMVCVKAQLFENDRRQLLLKVFVHETRKEKTYKVARAVYELEIVKVNKQTPVP